MRVRLSQQRWPLVAVLACVLLTHLLVTNGIAAHMHDLSGNDKSSIERLEAEYVADMKLTEPPVVIASTVAAQPQPEAAEVATRKASEPEPPRRPKKKKPEAAAPPLQAPEPPVVAEAASEPEAVVAEAPASTPAPASSPASAAAQVTESSASAPAFEWPLATRVTYKADGYFRGEVHGSALVEWIKRGDRYQVHSDVILGPRFAPIASRRFTSDGVITETGLVPERFESIDKLLVMSNTAKVLNFTADTIELPNGDKVPKPGLLRVGASIEMPLAWSKRQEMIAYDVTAEEELDTPLGRLKTFKLKPRRLNGERMEALADVWLAPSLQYLPVRIYLQQQGTNVFIDMQMDKPPQQLNADPGR